MRELIANNAANAEELTRVLAAHVAGGPVPATRTFEEREPPFRALADDLFLLAQPQTCPSG